MANARSHFDSIAGFLARTQEIHAGVLYGKPGLMLNDRAFAAYVPDAMAFRLHGRILGDALQIPGARAWDPLHEERSAPGWVLIPAEQFLRWEQLASEALRCAREAAERPVSYAVPPPPAPAQPDPPASTPESLAQRVASAVSSGFGSLTLADAPPERPPSTLDLD